MNSNQHPAGNKRKNEKNENVLDFRQLIDAQMIAYGWDYHFSYVVASEIHHYGSSPLDAFNVATIECKRTPPINPFRSRNHPSTRN